MNGRRHGTDDMSARAPKIRKVDQHTGRVAKTWAQAILDVCKCGHPAIAHTDGGEGRCASCVCGPFRLDNHLYPLGLVVTS
jgi:hypothetical protein